MSEATIAPEHDGPEAAVRQRYSAAAKAWEEALCCPVNYTPEYLEVIPPEGASRFDCGRSKHRHPRETKGHDYDATTESAGACTEGGTCC